MPTAIGKVLSGVPGLANVLYSRKQHTGKTGKNSLDNLNRPNYVHKLLPSH